MPLLILTLESRSSRVSPEAFSSTTTESMGTTAPSRPQVDLPEPTSPQWSPWAPRQVHCRRRPRVPTIGAFASVSPLLSISLGFVWLESGEGWSRCIPKMWAFGWRADGEEQFRNQKIPPISGFALLHKICGTTSLGVFCTEKYQGVQDRVIPVLRWSHKQLAHKRSILIQTPLWR
jgi:hypothetical protein